MKRLFLAVMATAMLFFSSCTPKNDIDESTTPISIDKDEPQSPDDRT